MTAYEIPKIFWKYYDLYRRKQLTLEVFSEKTHLTEQQIMSYLSELKKKKKDENCSLL